MSALNFVSEVTMYVLANKACVTFRVNISSRMTCQMHCTEHAQQVICHLWLLHGSPFRNTCSILGCASFDVSVSLPSHLDLAWPLSQLLLSSSSGSASEDESSGVLCKLLALGAWVHEFACIVVPHQTFGNPHPMWMFPAPCECSHLMWMFPIQCWDSPWSLYLLQNWTKQHETGINRKRKIRYTRICNQNLNWVTFGLCILKMVHFLMWTTISHWNVT